MKSLAARCSRGSRPQRGSSCAHPASLPHQSTVHFCNDSSGIICPLPCWFYLRSLYRYCNGTSKMSARAPVGASARQELFSARGRAVEEGKLDDVRGEGKDDASPSFDDELGPLQMQHIMGYAGDYRQTVLASVRDENVYIRSLGSLVCIENLADPHDQRLLRGHDMPVCALCVSPSGRMIASGQVGTRSFKGYAAPIFIWRAAQDGHFRRHLVLRGISYRANLIAISPDERFLCGCGEDKVLYVWDLSSGEVAYGTTLPAAASVMKWASCHRDGHYVAYDLVVGHGKELLHCRFSFQPDRVQVRPCLVPYIFT